jgi:putative transposase
MARFTFRGICYATMQLRDVLKPGIKIGAGSFNQDAQGPWSIRMPIEVECATEAPISRVDVDPAPLSDERQIEIPRSSTARARRYELVVVGIVKASKLAKTCTAKSVLDASWASFKGMLR